MPAKLRWGILGTGNIATQFTVGVKSSARGILAAAGSRQKHTAESFCQTHAIPRAHASYEALISDPQIDAIYNALPNSLHELWTIRALEAGKHVLCEKPLANTAAEAARMFDAAAKHRRLLVEAFMYRSHPQTLAVMQAVQSGAIGELRLIRTSFCYRTRKSKAMSVSSAASAAAGSWTSAATASISPAFLPSPNRQKSMPPRNFTPAA